jgi:iron(III) transport system substrate-binding protein
MGESKDVDILFLDQQGLGNLIIPNTLSLIKNSPNSKNAKKLFDYLLSHDTEKKLAISCAQMPLHQGVSVKADIPSLDEVVPMKIDYSKSAKKLEEIQHFLKAWVEDK